MLESGEGAFAELVQALPIPKGNKWSPRFGNKGIGANTSNLTAVCTTNADAANRVRWRTVQALPGELGGGKEGRRAGQPLYHRIQICSPRDTPLRERDSQRQKETERER